MSVDKRASATTRNFDEMYNKTGEDGSTAVRFASETPTFGTEFNAASRMLPMGVSLVKHVPAHTTKIGKRGRKYRIQNAGHVPNSLPVLSSEVKVHHTFRYVRVDTANVYDVTLRDLVNVLVAGASSTTTRSMFRAVRLHGLTIRGSVGGVGDTATVSVRYVGTGTFGNTDETKLMDSTNKIDVNAVVRKTPPRMSLASFWHDPNDASLSYKVAQLEYYGTGQCYLDVVIEAIVDMNAHINWSLTGGSGVQAGRIYGGYLVSGGWQPVGIVPIPGI